jgi:serine/threonine protein kinase/tetratricopeptide (TPR) repeat protein
MKPDQQREAALFQAASQLAGEARALFLNGACAADSALRARLEALLAAHDQSEGVLADTASPPATMKLDLSDAPDEIVGQKIGRYKILEKVGEGGCGVVYVAEQTEPVRRRVALKVIKLGMDTKAVVARFEAERQALAMMDHPNIAKVLDAGSTETGRPYFIMELVRGIRITEYCDQNHLSTNERLELFIKVCQAIQHAHQKGIIHRDIKPSNILVTLHDGVPVPKVIDFGIAKATEGRLTDATVYTQLHQFIGTPAYMSPEQAEMSGLDIDTRSDIYSLGVLLYELLTGSTPFDANELMSQGIDAMRRTIRERDPVRPSTKLATLQGEELTTTAKRRSVETSKLAKLLRGDLDWIVMKCLEKDRTRRYETANGLGVDLKRHLNNETVVARPPSKVYEFQKTVRRHKVAFVAATAVMVVMAIGIIMTTYQAVRATRARSEALAARRQAEAARGQAEGLVSFMMQDLQPALARYGRLPLLKQVVEKAIQYYEGLPPELRDLKTEFGLADTTLARAQILRASGDLNGAEAEFRKALLLYEPLAAKHPEIPEAKGGSLVARGELGRFNAAASSLSLAEQDARQRQGIHDWRELCGRFPTNTLVQRGFIQSLLIRAEIGSYQFNKPQEAIAAGLEAESMLLNLVAANPKDKELSVALAQSKTVMASAYEAMGQRDKSMQMSEEGVAYFGQALKDDPGNLELLARAARAEQFLSYRVSAISQKRARDAELAARERYRTLVELDPSNADWRYNFAMTHMMECYYLESAGELEAARQALKKFDALLQPVSNSALDREKLMANSIELARLAAMAGDIADARAQIANGEARFKAQYDRLPENSFDRIQSRVRWLYAQSRAFLGIHDWTELERVTREELSILETGIGQRPDDSELLLHRAVAQGYLGYALLRQNKASEALPMLQHSVIGYRETPSFGAFREDREAFSINATMALAEALATTGDIHGARALYESAVALDESRLAKQPDSWELKEALADGLVELAGALDPTEDAPRRQALLDRASRIINAPEAQNRLTLEDKEVKIKLEALRAAGPATR